MRSGVGGDGGDGGGGGGGKGPSKEFDGEHGTGAAEEADLKADRASGAPLSHAHYIHRNNTNNH